MAPAAKIFTNYTIYRSLFLYIFSFGRCTLQPLLIRAYLPWGPREESGDWLYLSLGNGRGLWMSGFQSLH